MSPSKSEASQSGFTFPLESLSCPWADLRSYCLAGTVFFVSVTTDLEELGQAVASDNNPYISKLLSENKIWKAHTEDVSPETICTFVIVQPFIFVGVPS